MEEKKGYQPTKSEFTAIVRILGLVAFCSIGTLLIILAVLFPDTPLYFAIGQMLEASIILGLFIIFCFVVVGLLYFIYILYCGLKNGVIDDE